MSISFFPTQERHLMLLPWLINAGLGMLFNILYVLGGFAGLIASPMPEPYTNIVLYTAVILGE